MILLMPFVAPFQGVIEIINDKCVKVKCFLQNF